VFDLEVEDYLAAFVPLDECAAAMNTTPERVRQLVKLRLLRTHWAWGDVLVRPDTVAGYVTT
jgi:hypothetical protein